MIFNSIWGYILGYTEKGEIILVVSSIHFGKYIGGKFDVFV